jgi:hypothetical protein
MKFTYFIAKNLINISFVAFALFMCLVITTKQSEQKLDPIYYYGLFAFMGMFIGMYLMRTAIRIMRRHNQINSTPFENSQNALKN